MRTEQTEAFINEIIGMAWADDISFDKINLVVERMAKTS